MRGNAVILLGDIALADELHNLAKRINVGTRVVVLAFDDFGRNKLHLLDKKLTVSILVGFGNADINQFDPIIVGGNQDILWHQVAMDHPVAVHILQGITNLNEDVLHLFFRKCTHTHMLGQSLALNKLKDSAIAQSLDIDEIECLTEILVVEHIGRFILLTQGGSASFIMRKIRLQSLDNDLLAIVTGSKDPAIAVTRGIKRSDIGIVFREDHFLLHRLAFHLLLNRLFGLALSRLALLFGFVVFVVQKNNLRHSS